MTSRREQIEDFFANKDNDKLNAGRALDHDGGDIEDYQSAMLNRSKANAQSNVDGKRRADAGNLLEQKAYLGKRVSRQDLEKQHSESNSENDDDEDDDESMEDEESGEQESSSGNEEQAKKQEVDDSDLEQSDGIDESGEAESQDEQSKVSDSDSDEEEQQFSEEESAKDEELEQQAKIHSLGGLKGAQQQADDNDIDAAVKALKQQATVESAKATKRKAQDNHTDQAKAKAVQIQKKVCDTMLQQRILLQQLLSSSNKLPQGNHMSLFLKNDKETRTQSLATKRELKKYMKEMAQVQKNLYRLSETDVEISVPSEDREDYLESTWKTLMQNFDSQMPFLESTIDRWNERTHLQANINNQKQKKSAFSTTIIEQINTMLNDEESKRKVLDKCHQKREMYRVLGKDATDIEKENDECIYNDYEFYQQLLSDFLTQHEDEIAGAEGEAQEGDKDFLHGADLNLTQRYLQKRQKMQEAQQANKPASKKEVDRKASKARKIRYIVHERIVNFMTEVPNVHAFEGRDAIVNNMFGVYQTYFAATDTEKGLKDGGVKLI